YRTCTSTPTRAAEPVPRCWRRRSLGLTRTELTALCSGRPNEACRSIGGISSATTATSWSGSGDSAGPRHDVLLNIRVHSCLGRRILSPQFERMIAVLDD